MVRTRADAGATKVSAAKAPRKVLTGGASSSAGGASSSSGRTPGKEKYSGCNGYNPQPTPTWQKGIQTYFKSTPKPETSSDGSVDSNAAASSSSSDFANNGVIDDDDE